MRRYITHIKNIEKIINYLSLIELIALITFTLNILTVLIIYVYAALSLSSPFLFPYQAEIALIQFIAILFANISDYLIRGTIPRTDILRYVLFGAITFFCVWLQFFSAGLITLLICCYLIKKIAIELRQAL